MRTNVFKIIILCGSLILIKEALGIATEACDTTFTTAAIGIQNASVILTGMMALYKPGEGGYGCSAVPDVRWTKVFEAMRWSIELLNRDSGVLNGRRLTDTYIPGVKFGLQITATCGHPETALTALKQTFPALVTTESQCAPNGTSVLPGEPIEMYSTYPTTTRTGEVFAPGSTTRSLDDPAYVYAVKPARRM
ncbi:uncharacterized protein LOC106178875 [Lingula anatina]|uniref:Uncharacterized protein LOC106178875 n=1 Tax=Lingula anatina TaxID=7574 RepID=A0A1S3K5I5_LINAN|nr:uncharacterized protein LOC106178875 [Lingula anatina]|eukprot:XP_013417684.1 uncharacterized protein LOC106178875 [Lingula anatina]